MFASRGVADFQAAQPHQFLSSRFYKFTADTGVIWCPGVTNTERTFIDPLFAVSGPVAERYPICSFSAANTWGNDTSIARVEAMRNWLNGRFGVSSSGFYLVGISHGAPIALNWARQHLSLVKAVALMIPAVDVEDIRANDRGSYQASIETAYTNNTAWQAARSTHNPTDYPSDLSGVPMKAWYASDDPICTAAAVDAFATATGCEKQSLGAVGHDAASVDPLQVLDFFAEHP